MTESMSIDEAVARFTNADGEVVIPPGVLILPPVRVPTSKRIKDAEERVGKPRRAGA